MGGGGNASPAKIMKNKQLSDTQHITFLNWILKCEIWEVFASYSSGPARRGLILHRPRLWKPAVGSSCKKQRGGQQSVENLQADAESVGEHTMLFSHLAPSAKELGFHMCVNGYERQGEIYARTNREITPFLLGLFLSIS